MKKLFLITVCFFILQSGFILAQTTIEIERILRNKNISAFDRFSKVDSIIRVSDIPQKDKYNIEKNILAKFIVENIHGEDFNYCMASNYNEMAISQPIASNVELTTMYYDSAVFYVDKIPNSRLKALVYKNYANNQNLSGSQKLAHDFLYKSIKICSELPDPDYSMMSSCYYSLAIAFHNLKDVSSVEDIISKMGELAFEANLPNVYYDYYSVKSAYFSNLYESNTENTALRDSMIDYGRMSIVEMEKIDNPLVYEMFPTWNYYNMAIFYDVYFDDPIIDSVDFYLDKAEMATQKFVFDEIGRCEAYASIYDLRAWLYFYNKDYDNAEKTMNNVLALLDTLDLLTPNTVVVERSEAYKFFVQYYETLGKYEQALMYQKLLSENDKKRYDIDKDLVLKDLNLKHQVENKENQIALLKEQNLYAKNMLIFSILIIVACVLLIVLLCRIYFLKRKNLNQKLFEAAMINEINQNDLAQNETELRKLHLEYDRIKELASKNKSEAQIYADELQTIKKRLVEIPSKMLVDKVINELNRVSIDNKNVDAYKKQLISIDLEELEKLFESADENLTAMEKKYMVCFFINMSIKDISVFFNVEPASIYTVRYRIKKKYNKSFILPFK